MKTVMTAILVIIALSFIVGIYLYPQMPDEMASHWNAKGEVNGYMSRFWGLFLMPLMSLGLFGLFLAIPRIDPLKSNIKKFMNYYEGMIFVIVFFMFYVHMLTLLWSLGFVFDMTQMLIPSMGLLFIYSGFLIGKAKRNWFIGIRNPWTLSSEKVWEKTHNLGGKLFKAMGIVILFGAVFPEYALWLILVPVFSVVIYLFAYSYFEYQKEHKKK